MWIKDKKYIIKINYDRKEIIKRLKGHTEEPSDISKVVPMDIYKFRGNISAEPINLIFYSGATLRILNLKITFSENDQCEMHILYGHPKYHKVISNIFGFIFLFVILQWVFDPNSFLGAIIISTLWGIILLFGNIFMNYLAKKYVSKTFNYINSDKFNYENTKYKFS